MTPGYSRTCPGRPAATGERKSARSTPLRLLPVISPGKLRGVYCASTRSRCDWLELPENREPYCGCYGGLDQDQIAGLPTRDDECLQHGAPSRASQGREREPNLTVDVQGPKARPDTVTARTSGGNTILVTNYANGVSSIRIDRDSAVLTSEVLFALRAAHADPFAEQIEGERRKSARVKSAAKQLIGTIRDLFSGQPEKVKAEFEAAIRSLEREMEDA